MPDTLFRAKSPEIMRKLMADFGLTEIDAAAILGNIGHECAGFKLMQEVKPVVPGSRGGFGWCQWTGPRRRAFEAWCKRQDYSPYADHANYSFLFRELKGYEGEPAFKAIEAVKKAKTLKTKTTAFEMTFLRAGVKHYPSRHAWAERALEAWRGQPVPLPDDPGVEEPASEEPWWMGLFRLLAWPLLRK